MAETGHNTSLLLTTHLQKRKQSLKQQRSYFTPTPSHQISNTSQLLNSLKTKLTHKEQPKTIENKNQPQHKKEEGKATLEPIGGSQGGQGGKRDRAEKIQGLINLCFRDRKKYIDGRRIEGRLRYRTEGEVQGNGRESLINLSKLRVRSNRSRAMSRLERINQYSLHRLQNPSQQPRYKNQKISIISNHQQKIRKLTQDETELKKFESDLKYLVEQFTLCLQGKGQPERHANQNLRTALGRLLFFIGYEITIRFSDSHESQYQVYQLVLCNYYQIYYSMKLNLPLIILQCYLVLMDFSLQKSNYPHAQKYAQKCLQASIFYRQKYYQQKSIQKISMCEYYKGNICEATYLHDNNGMVAPESIRKIRDGYSESEELEIIFHHLYEMPRFDVRELLASYDESMKGYKAMVIFQSPRIGVDDSMQNKKNQLKIDLISMQRSRQYKQGVTIMKKQVKRHENLFQVSVHKPQAQSPQQFKLVKRSPVIDDENQSSQVLRAHQSLNRVCNVNKRPMQVKLVMQFVGFCQGLLGRIG